MVDAKEEVQSVNITPKVFPITDNNQILEVPVGAPVVHVITDRKLLQPDWICALVLELPEKPGKTVELECTIIADGEVLSFPMNKPKTYYGSMQGGDGFIHIYLSNVETTDEVLDKLIPEEDDDEDASKEEWEKIRDKMKKQQPKGEAT